MSYDYASIVKQFHEARRRALLAAAAATTTSSQQQQEQWQTAVELVHTLVSQHGCPLTPLLWIQYGHAVSEYCQCCTAAAASSTTTVEEEDNTAATRLELEVLQQACREFPGSALLWMRRVSLLLQHQNQHPPLDDNNDDDDWSHVLQQAIQAVGRGSHRNQDAWIVTLYRLWAWKAAKKEATNNSNLHDDDNDSSGTTTTNLARAWIQRSQTPMRQANDSIMSEWEAQKKQQPLRNNNDSIAAAMEEGRRQAARLWTAFATREDEIDVALQQEGIAAVPHISSSDNATTTPHDDELRWEWQVILPQAGIDWDTILLRSDETATYGMGYGGTVTAHAFGQYAHALQQFRVPKNLNDKDDNAADEDDIADDHWKCEAQVQAVALDVYERGVAECPTVEALWLSYLRDLQHWIVLGQQQPHNPLFTLRASLAAARFGTVAERACRNCPYSVALLQQKLLAVLLLASWTGPSSNALHDNDSLHDTMENNGSDARVVVDPDQLLEYVQQGLDTQFLPNQPSVVLDLYLTAIRVVKRRILWILTHRLPVDSVDAKQSNGGTKTATKPMPRRQHPLAYDDSEPLPNCANRGRSNKIDDKSSANLVATNHSNDNDDDDSLQEAQDLLDDLSDMYDQAESRLRQAHPSWTEGRALLWKDRAQTEFLLENPLRGALARAAGIAGTTTTTIEDDSDFQPDDLKSLEKCIRFHNPPHPDLYSLYIRQYITWITATPATKPDDVVVRIRQVRGLFEKALHSVGITILKRQAKSKGTVATLVPQSTCLPFRDYPSALANLCHEWLDFERTVGSERSLGKAANMVEKKFQKASTRGMSSRSSTAAVAHAAPPQPTPLDKKDGDDAEVDITDESSPSRSKRKHEADMVKQTENGEEAEHGPTKKTKVEVSSTSSKENAGDQEKVAMETEALPAEETKPATTHQTYKVRIGKLEYPSHPFTVRVSNLSPQVQDMDLIDLFRPKCGAIVHARIMREKHHPHDGHNAAGKGLSRGWGLIQFEERESVEKALALDDVVGLDEKLVRVQRSHMPAATLVPPGMHRVRPTGEGKVSKRNEKRRDQQKRKMSEDSIVHPASARGDAASAVDGRVDDNVTKSATTDATLNPTSTTSAAAAPISSSTKTSVLSFRPRGVARKDHPKQRLQLKDKYSGGTSDKP